MIWNYFPFFGVDGCVDALLLFVVVDAFSGYVSVCVVVFLHCCSSFGSVCLHCHSTGHLCKLPICIRGGCFYCVDLCFHCCILLHKLGAHSFDMSSLPAKKQEEGFPSNTIVNLALFDSAMVSISFRSSCVYNSVP